MRWHQFREHLGDDTRLMRRWAGGSSSPSRSSSTPRRSIGTLLFERRSTSRSPKSGGFQSGRLGRGQSAAVLAEVNDDLERSVRTLTVELADLKGDASRGAIGLRDRPHAGARAAQKLPKRAEAELTRAACGRSAGWDTQTGQPKRESIVARLSPKPQARCGHLALWRAKIATAFEMRVRTSGRRLTHARISLVWSVLDW